MSDLTTNFKSDGNIDDIDYDEDVELTDEDIAFSEMIDRIAEDEERSGKRSDRISKELIESLVDELRQMKFMFKNSVDPNSGEVCFSQEIQDAVNNKVSCILATYAKDSSIPKKCFKAKISNGLGTGLVDKDDRVEVVLLPEDAARLFCENNFIKYRTADAIEQFLREEYPECFKERKENYINPAAIADPASRMIMSMDIPVTDHRNLQSNFEELIYQRGTDIEECDDVDIKFIESEPVFSHEGSYRGHKTMITIYLCLTKQSLIKQSVICPDCLISCEDQVSGEVKDAIFNLKTGYSRKDMKWKSDYGSITRKIKTILKDEEMTDFKQQDSKRGKRGRGIVA